MKGSIAVVAIVALIDVAGLLALGACANAPTPDPGYTQSRAIDQDIDATRDAGPVPTAPSAAGAPELMH
jgi:hypothetical protein